MRKYIARLYDINYVATWRYFLVSLIFEFKGYLYRSEKWLFMKTMFIKRTDLREMSATVAREVYINSW